MNRTQETGAYSIRAIDRAIQILLCFSRSRTRLTLGELAEQSGLSKSTAFRILQTLQQKGFIAYNPTSSQYALGIRLFELGRLVFSTLQFHSVVAPFLDRLALKGERTVLAAVIEGKELLYIDQRERKASMRLESQIGKRRPPHFGMLGKTLMAYLPEAEVDALLKCYPLEKIAPRTVVNPQTFKKHLKEIRAKGYYFEDNEAIVGMVGIAAPVRNQFGEVIAAIGVTFPSIDIDKKTIADTIAAVKEATVEISLGLGYHGFEDRLR